MLEARSAPSRLPYENGHLGSSCPTECPREAGALILQIRVRHRCQEPDGIVYDPAGIANRHGRLAHELALSLAIARKRAFVQNWQIRAEEKQLEMLLVNLVVVMAQLVGYISIQWQYDYEVMDIAHSSTASSGPTVLRRGRGCEIFRPCRRTLFVGDSVESMVGRLW